LSILDFNVGPTLPSLSSSRLRLRWLAVADVPALFTIFGDAAVTRYWSHPALPDLSAAQALLSRIHDRFHKRTLFQWGLELVETGAVIGTCTLAALDTTHRRAELGYALARAFWKHGYLSEILPVLFRFAFERLRLHRIVADVDPRNGASIRLLERQGFRREGYLREHYHFQGEVQDAAVYGLLRSEFSWSESGK
jgi:ribosomal-protein-alanine N-acetyltransferase